MEYRMEPHWLGGCAAAPADPHTGLLFVLCAALARGASRIEGLADTPALRSLAAALNDMGAQITLQERDGAVDAMVLPGRFAASPQINCGGSAGLFELILAPALVLCGGAVFSHCGALPAATLASCQMFCKRHRIRFKAEANGTASAQGWLGGGAYALPAGTSAAFACGLMAALPLCGRDWRVRLDAPGSHEAAQAAAQSMERFGVRTVCTSAEIISFCQLYQGQTLPAPRSLLSAAYLLCGATGDHSVALRGLTQGLPEITEIMEILAQVHVSCQWKNGLLQGQEAAMNFIERSTCSDPTLLPALAARCVQCGGVIGGLSALPYEEAGLPQAIVEMIGALGGQASYTQGALRVEAAAHLPGGRVNCKGDVRIAMAAAILSPVCEEAVTLTGIPAFPFPEAFSALGGRWHALRGDSTDADPACEECD
ncbi:MAG: hypothetical protein PHD32_05255 [Eubacteriales bacterium]|nr:hypothetical protein [Eubacteriales bacterium]